jgi:mono/diheme cytochrome c family protein
MKICDLIVATAVIFLGFGAARAQDVSFGQRLFRDKADCQFCHGIDGDGRGDPRSPGRAANLHQTRLDREQLIEVIACGRPGTEMPQFDKYAYEDTTAMASRVRIWAPMRRAIRIRRR